MSEDFISESKLLTKVQKCKVEENEVLICWLGQAGFLLKSSSNKTIAIDPYISHYGEKVRGFKRLSPILIEAEDFNVDYYITSHKHFDHYDYEAIPVINKKYKTKFYGAISCVEEFEKMETENKMTLLERWKELEIENGIKILPTFADHGTLEPEAIGLILKINNTSIYFTGDTSLALDNLKEIENSNFDIIVASVNGAFGNLTPRDGVQLADYTKAKHLIPCHFWTFIEHKGEPGLLKEEIISQNSKVELDLLTPGELYLFNKELNTLKML